MSFALKQSHSGEGKWTLSARSVMPYKFALLIVCYIIRFTLNVKFDTASKQPWVILPPDKPAFEEYYRRSEHMSEASLERLSELTTGNS